VTKYISVSGRCLCLGLAYTAVRHKNTPKFVDHNFKANYQILIIFGTTISDKTCHQTVIKFPPHSTYASALPREIKTHKISIKINIKTPKTSVTLLIVTWSSKGKKF